MRIIKDIVQRFLGLFGYRIASTYDSVMDTDERFVRIMRLVRPYTLTTKERMYALYKSVEYILAARIPGDFVECGVWAGGSSMLVAATLLEFGVSDRTIYLYDTFEGMTAQTAEDVHVEDKTVRVYDPSCVPLDAVKAHMALTNYPQEKIVFVKGKVEDTIPQTLPSGIVLLRLDTDWYESTKHELDHLFPLVSRGGVLIIDDYGAWAGAKKATDDYVAKHPLLLHRIDRDGRIAIKTT